MESVKVRDYMTRHPVMLTTQTPLSNAVEALLKAGQAGAPVIDSEGMLVGFASEKDCLSLLLKSSYHCDLTATVAEVMRPDVLTVTPDDSVLALADQMLGDKPKIYPVVEAGKVVGMIDRSKVLQAVSTHLKVCFRHAV
ncbi:CBS domain-containing protein [Ferrimonas pelagia]|uniref:CBS domain-containing protein n=1 Tax=Ferrimonas pelagia TaxID=1177826 RepID=A0ABP9EIS8_9GAMM